MPSATGSAGNGPASTARRKYVPSYQNEIACKNKRFPRPKLGTAYRNWPRQYGRATSRAQHRYAALVQPEVDYNSCHTHHADIVDHAYACTHTTPPHGM